MNKLGEVPETIEMAAQTDIAPCVSVETQTEFLIANNAPAIRSADDRSITSEQVYQTMNNDDHKMMSEAD